MQSTSDESKKGGKAPLKRSREGCMEDKGGPNIRNCKYRGVRQRKLGNWVAEIREPNKRKRIWLASRSMYGSTAFLNLPNYNCPNRSSNNIASSVPSNLGCTSSITSNHTECSSANMVVDSTKKKNGTKNISKSNLEGKLSLGEIKHQGTCRNSVSGNVHQSTLDDLQCTLSPESHQCAEPVPDPTWSGSFDICDRGTLGGFVACASSKACQKVHDEACLFPSTLELEMVPKSQVWPEDFLRSESSDDMVSLYFFPEDARNVEKFDGLVDEMIHQGLAMRTIMKNAALLIFTSMELPRPYWRFQGKHYLWGVFREE